MAKECRIRSDLGLPALHLVEFIVSATKAKFDLQGHTGQ